MPTQEERIVALEQKTATHIQEMDENFTIDEHTSLLTQILSRLT